MGDAQLRSKPGVYLQVPPVVHTLLDVLVGQGGGGDASQEHLLSGLMNGHLNNAKTFLQASKEE